MQMFNERMKARGQGGFTLIELLIVIAILGILAGVVVFAVGGVQGTATNKACEIEGKSVETAIQAAIADGAASTDVPDLDPVYLKSDASANWELDGASTTEVIGVGGSECDGITPT
jgi:prepilin-type N-terminal cleavage/methylation domain-containing protein